MSNIAATLSLNVPAITALCLGPRGSQILAASGTPSNPSNNSPGLSGDYYIDTSTGYYYGPKTNSWPTIPIFSLNYPVSSYPLTLVQGTTSLIVSQYGNNILLGNYSNILGGQNNSLSGNNSGILGGQNNALTANNSFIIGSNITATISGFIFVNNLSSTGTIFTPSGYSDLWQSSYTAVSPNSANWNSAYTAVSPNSANWNSAYTNLTANSANWNTAYTNITSNSGNWQSAYTVTSTLAYVTYTLNSTLSTIVPSRGTFTATGTASNIGGGNFNSVLSSYSSVLGGIYNTASGNYSNVTGGFSGRASGLYSNIAGGVCNTASGYSASIGGGSCNIASGTNSAIGAGCGNTANNSSTYIGGGRNNTASGLRSAIVGGLNNTASGDYSFIAGGSANDTKNYAGAIVLGTGLSANRSNTTFVNNISSQNTVLVGGNVGIGTSSPVQQLEVVGNTVIRSNGQPVLFLNNTNGSQWKNTIQFQKNFLPSFEIGTDIHSAGDNNLYFWDGVNSVERMRIAANGNIGIGTSSPTGQLTVVGAGQVGGNVNTTGALGGSIVLGDTGGAVGNGGAIYLAAGGAAWNFAAIKGYVTDGANNSRGDITFSTRRNPTDSTLSESMRITSSGNVGIGTTSPVYPLDVVGDINTSGNIRAGSSFNYQTASYTLSPTDIGGIVGIDSGSALTVTVPNTITRIGYQASIIRLGTGPVTISAGSGVTINQAYGLSALAAQYSAATVLYTGVSRGWILFGDLA
jgi:hypothetical protein